MADEVPTATTEESVDETTSKQPASESKTMSVKIYAPFQVYFEGEAMSVSAVNATGPFDILPRHRNFLCMLVPCDLVVQPAEGNKRTIKIHRALMHVQSNRVVVFMDV